MGGRGESDKRDEGEGELDNVGGDYECCLGVWGGMDLVFLWSG